MATTENQNASPTLSSVRDATISDIPFFMEQEARPDYQGLIFQWPEEKHRAGMEDPDKRYRVMENTDGSLLGYAILGNLTQRRPILVRLVAAQSGKGVGGTLLAEAIDHVFTKTNAMVLYLDVFPENTRAIALYERVGFREAIKLRRATTINGVEKPLLVMALEKSV